MTLTKHRAGWSLLAMAFLALTGGCSGGESESGAIESADSTTPAGTATLQTRSLTPPELLTLMEEPDGPLILDVRSPQEYREGHIQGAVNIPYDQLAGRLGELEVFRDQGVVVYCRTGRRAGIAEQTLEQAGFGVVWDLQGHMVAWREGDYPLVVPVMN
jgi:rhodanese-related sulfurtransferase